VINDKIADLFNEVMGPVMCGPSSSHTGGPSRIGRLAHDLCNGTFDKAVVEFSDKGSYSYAYQGDGSDKGLATGLMGLEPDDPGMFYAIQTAKKKGLDIEFVITADEVPHVNAITLKLSVPGGRTIKARMISLGGGSVQVESIDGLGPIPLYGGRFETVVYGGGEAQSGAQRIIGSAPVAQNDALCVFSTEAMVDLAAVQALPGVSYAATLCPVVPCVNRDGASAPFLTASQMLHWLIDHPVGIVDAAVAYQSALSGWDKPRILAWCDHLLNKMEQSIQTGLSCDGRGFFSLKPTSGKLEALRKRGGFINTGIIDHATVMATAVMESNMSMNVVIAAPTGGSAGVIPGVLFALGEAGYTRAQMAEGLLVAALVGAFIYNQATFTASVGGCAVEIGSASSMAAAGAAAMAGGDVDTCLRAAGLALGNLTGLACDHLSSGVEVPCIQRNAMGSANAIICANMAAGGMDPVLGYDESIEAMIEFGKLCVGAVRACNRQGCAGAAGTATGLRVRDEYMAQFEKSRQ
jgi:L-serine dehydratase